MFVLFAAVPQNSLKLLVLIVIGGGLLALGRWSSRLGSTKPEQSPADIPTPDAPDLIADSKPKLWPPSAEEVAASLPFDPLLGNLRIRKWYFDKTDVTPGPYDPEVFAEELHVELYDPESGHSWWHTYFVATPLGLANTLREKHWRYLHAPSVLVFPRYDFDEIRRAVVSRIVAENDLLKSSEQGEEEDYL
jgi:hypothetical protein